MYRAWRRQRRVRRLTLKLASVGVRAARVEEQSHFYLYFDRHIALGEDLACDKALAESALRFPGWRFERIIGFSAHLPSEPTTIGVAAHWRSSAIFDNEEEQWSMHLLR